MKVKKRKKKKKNGFTLVELLVAVAILGIIMVIALPQISNLQATFGKTKYEKYAEYITNAAKLYTDSYSKDMFGNNDVGCYEIRYSQMRNISLINDIKVNDVTCAGDDTFVRVYKSGSHYGYNTSIYCKDKNGEVYSQNTTGPECTAISLEGTAPTITISPNGTSGTGWSQLTNTYKNINVSVFDISGLMRLTKIKYAVVPASTTDYSTAAYTNYTFNNDVRGQGTVDAPLIMSFPYPTDKNGEYKVVVVPVDVKNTKQIKAKDTIVSNTFRIDSDKPVFSNVTTGSGKWVASETTSANVTDATSGVKAVYYGTSKTSMNKSDWTRVDGSKYEKDWADMTNSEIFMYAEDNAGNKSDTVSAGKIMVDGNPPTCTITVSSGTKGDNDWYKSTVKFGITRSDGETGVSTYGMTNSTTADYNKKTSYEVKGDTASVTIYGYVKDKANNVGTCSKTVKIDSTKPSCSLSASASGIAVTSKSDGTSGLAYYGWSSSYSGTSSDAVASLTGGTTTYYVKDSAGNTNTCKKELCSTLKNDSSKGWICTSGPNSSGGGTYYTNVSCGGYCAGAQGGSCIWCGWGDGTKCSCPHQSSPTYSCPSGYSQLSGSGSSMVCYKSAF